MSQPILELKDLDVFYGPIQALKKVSLHINEGETVSLIGSNGAGKSTLLMSIFGQPRAADGQIIYQGVDITHKSSHYIASHGIAQSPEGRRVFPDMTVEENLLMGTIPIGDKYAKEDMQRMFELFPRLEERRTQRAMTMSGGEQQMLAIARALINDPKLLILDEPTEGLAPVIVDELVKILRKIKDDGLPVLLVEQNLMVCDKLADRHYVLEQGRVVYEGSAADFRANPAIKNRYLALSA